MTTATMPERATGRKLGDVRAVAEKLDCSPRHVYRMADAGRMPCTASACFFGPMGLGRNRPLDCRRLPLVRQVKGAGR